MVFSRLVQGSYPGPIPATPAAPATAAVALPATAPALDLGLTQVIIIVAGDVEIASDISGVLIQRR